ncbi:MAG: hypothetical protein ACRELY_19720 [Polyangiaceae bacterium]
MSRVVVFFALVLAVAAASALFACGIGFSNQCGTSAGNTGTGSSPCGTDTCTGGSFCANPAGNVCENGCKSDDNCPTGQRCDLTNAQTDLGGNKVGQCVNQQLGSSSSVCDGGGSSDAGDDGSSKPTDAGRDAS